MGRELPYVCAQSNFKEDFCCVWERKKNFGLDHLQVSIAIFKNFRCFRYFKNYSKYLIPYAQCYDLNAHAEHTDQKLMSTLGMHVRN